MYPSRVSPVAQIIDNQLDDIGHSKKDIELDDRASKSGKSTHQNDSKDSLYLANGSLDDRFEKSSVSEATKVIRHGNQGTSSGYNFNNQRNSRDDFSSNDNIHSIISAEEGSIEGEEEFDQDEDSVVYPDGGWKAWSVVLGSFLGSTIVFGIMNTIGAIETELETNILQDSSISSVSWVFSIYMFFSLFGGLIVGASFDTIGGKPLLIAGTLVQFAGMFACGSCTELWQFIVSFGVVVGLGTALSLTPVIACVSHYFKKKRGFAIGIAQSGGNVGGIIFPIMLRSLYPNIGFVWSMRIFAFMVLVLSGSSIFLCTDRLEELTKKATPASTSSAANSTTASQSKWKIIAIKVRSSIDLNSFKDRSFLLLVAGLFINEFSLLLVLTYLSSYAVVRGWSISTSYVMITVLNSCGTVGKWVAAKSADLFGPFNVMLCMSAVMSLLIFVIWGPLGGTGALWAFVTIFGFCCSATYSLSGACVAHISKTSDFGRRYGTAYSFVSFGNLISLPLGGALIKQGSVSDYNNMVWFAGATCLLGTILFVLSRISVGGYRLRAYV